MGELPNEICVYILRFLSFIDLLALSKVSEKFYLLCNQRNGYEKLIDIAWNLYIDKKVYCLMLDDCRLGIYSDLKKSFNMFRTKQYLCVCLEKNYYHVLKTLIPCVSLFILLIVIEK